MRTDVPQQAVRAIKNQALLRRANERIDDLSEDAAVILDNLEKRAQPSWWACECVNEDCRELVQLSIAAYQLVRAHGNRFVVMPGEGHFQPTTERVLECQRDYWVVKDALRAA